MVDYEKQLESLVDLGQRTPFCKGSDVHMEVVEYKSLMKREKKEINTSEMRDCEVIPVIK